MVLIILPPSETKRTAPDIGPALDLDDLSFPELTPMRTRILDALVATSLRPDAMRRLLVGPSIAAEVARNAILAELPTRPAAEVYAGPLYGGLEPSAWAPRVHARADREVIIVSPLWGALRPADRIPPYRLHVCARLAGLDRLEPMWRTVLPSVLADAAGPDGVILDLRSPAYRAVGRPVDREDRTVTIRVRQWSADGRRVGDVIAKRMRGEAARHLLESHADPDDPVEVAELLAAHWQVEIEPPDGADRAWTIIVEPPH